MKRNWRLLMTSATLRDNLYGIENHFYCTTWDAGRAHVTGDPTALTTTRFSGAASNTSRLRGDQRISDDSHVGYIAMPAFGLVPSLTRKAPPWLWTVMPLHPSTHYGACY
jgi:hypothetical protein